MTPLKPNAMKSMQIIRNAVLLLSLITLGPLSSTAVTPGIVSSPEEKASVMENPAMTTAPTAIAAHPVETPSSLTLEECYAKAGTNYPLVSRYGLIQQSEQYSLSNANKGYLPQFSLSAKATYQTDVTKIPVSIPGVDIPTLNKDQYQALVELDQVIWDGGTIRSQKRNINASTEVDRQQQQVDMYAIRERINSLFFGTLLLEEQLKLNTLYDEELARNYQKVQSFIANGVANAADLDAVKVEQLSNRQRRAELEATCKAYRQMLGAFTGTDLARTELIQPIAADKQPLPEIRRPELHLFNAQNSLLDAAQALVKNGYTIYATAGTAKFLNENNVKATAVGWPDEEHKDLPNVMQMIADHKFDLIVNIPKNHTKRELTNGYRIRRGAIDHNIPLITNARLASAFIEAFCTMSQDQLQIKSWQEYE